MKPWVFLFSLLLSLLTVGSSCVSDGALVSLNLNPIVGRFKVGTNPTFRGAVVVRLDSLISSAYQNTVRQGRVYDIRVRSEGDYSGAISGQVSIQVGNAPAKQLLIFPRTGAVAWSVFHTPQSILTNSENLAPQPAGISELLKALTTVPLPAIILATEGTMSVAPVPDNLYVIIEVYIQADAEL